MEYNKKSLANKAIVSFINGKQQNKIKKYIVITNRTECEQNILMSALIFQFLYGCCCCFYGQFSTEFSLAKLWVLEMILF